MNDFGEYVKMARKAIGLKTSEVARLSTVSASLISRIENGTRGIPKPDTLEKLSKALKVPYEEMMRKAGYLNEVPTEETAEQLSIIRDIDPDLLQKFAEIIKDDPYQSLFFDDILSASKEEREEIVREWLELRKKFREKRNHEWNDEKSNAWERITDQKKK